VFAESEQGAPLARASTSIPFSGSPLSVEVRREDEGGEQTDTAGKQLSSARKRLRVQELVQ